MECCCLFAYYPDNSRKTEQSLFIFTNGELNEMELDFHSY